MSENIRDEMTGYNPEAVDGDKDGMVQDATPFERPEGTDLTEEQVAEIINEGKTAEDVITASSTGGSGEESVLAPVEDGVIGTSTRKKEPKAAAKQATRKNSKKEELVAIYSARNISWTGVGKVKKGYSFVSAEDAEKWSTIDGVKIADPSEIKGLA
jgi:hypothetical protein